jgi:hypothetical protein
MDKIKKYEDQIEKASKIIEPLLDLKVADKASFDSDKEEKLQYWKEEKQRLCKLLLMAKDESTTPAPAPPGNSITPPQVLPLASFLSSPSFFRIFFRQPLQLNYKHIVEGLMRRGREAL